MTLGSLGQARRVRRDTTHISRSPGAGFRRICDAVGSVPGTALPVQPEQGPQMGQVAANRPAMRFR